MKGLAPLLAAGMLLVPGITRASEGLGFAEVRLSLYPGAEGEVWQVVERVRPTFEQEITDRIALVGTLEAGLSQGRDNTAEFQRILDRDLGELLDAFACSWPEHANTHLGIDSRHDYLDVDRLYVDIYSKYADIRVGRQALNWGSAQFLNPTDPFPEVLFAEPWRPRRGVNAVRATIPFGTMNDVQAVVGTNDLFTEARAALRVRVNWLETDFALTGAWRTDADSGLIGFDVRGTLELGWWIEGAVNLSRQDGVDPYAAVTVGLDYSFPVLDNLIVMAQYHYNGAGATNPDDYAVGGGLFGAVALPVCDTPLPPGAFGDSDPSAAGEPDPFAPFTRAQNYLMLAVNLAIDEWTSASFFALQNLDDGTAIMVPTVSYAALDWLELSLSAQVPVAVWGRGGEFKPRAGDLVLEDPSGTFRADFSGLVPDATVTLWTRASF